MNEVRPYEQLIAAKLDQLPVPDMSDGIWAGIEEQLGEGAGSADEPGATPDGPGSAFKGKIWFGLAGVAVVITLLWWYFGHRGPAPARPVVLPGTHVPAHVEPPRIEDSGRSDKPAKKKDLRVAPVEIKKDTAAYHAVPTDSVRTDSAVRQMLPPMKVDSGSSQKNKPVLQDVDLYEAPQVRPSDGKRHKGVKGISADDYKISAGKDSAKKRN